MKENKYAKITLKDINKLTENLEKKLQVSKIKVYGSAILSVSMFAGTLKLVQEAIETFFNTIYIDKFQFGSAALLGIASSVLLANNIVYYAPELKQLKNDKILLIAKKRELIKASKKINTNRINSVKTKDKEVSPLKEYIQFKEIEKALNIQIDKKFAVIKAEQTVYSPLKEYIKRKNI